MSKPIDRLLAGLTGDPSKPQKPVNILAKLLRKIWLDRAMTPMKWGQHLERYVTNPYNGVRSDPTAQASARSNLMRELKNHKITQDVFTKGISFLEPEEATLMVRLRWADGTVTIHEEDMGIRSPRNLEDDDDEDDDKPTSLKEMMSPANTLGIPRVTREEEARRRAEIRRLMEDDFDGEIP